MSKRYQKSLFIFRRDYRLEDNIGLLKCLEDSKEVIPVFCFDPNQFDSAKNDYFGVNSFRFLIESLNELYDDLQNRDSKLHFLKGKPNQEITKLAESESCDAVYCNHDYTPYSKNRDQSIKTSLDDSGIDFVQCHDLLLTIPGTICTNSGDPYKVFTPFKNKAKKQTIKKPIKNNFSNFVKIQNKNLFSKSILNDLIPAGESSRQIGGRSNGLKAIRKISEIINYDKNRDYPNLNATTELSAHLKFGTVSIREVYQAVVDSHGNDSRLLTELYWRDFYIHVLDAFPYVLGDEFQEKYQGLDWSGVEGTDKAELLEAWQQGKTGFPIIDAGMRQLLTEGWMHNRVRMLVASFLTKDLHLDWREGEKWFAKHLVDYDVANNNGGWQWAASTGTDAQPYFRIFNPWSQQNKYDPDCEYIKKYVPELKSIDSADLHKLGGYDLDKLDKVLGDVDYPKPIINHETEREVAIESYKNKA